MKIVSNESVIKRNSRIGLMASFISPILFVLSGSTLLNSQKNTSIALVLLILGFIFFQTGIAFRKWGRGAEETLGAALKKLGKEYTLYNFHTPVSHLLVGPAGYWILIPKYTKGMITYNEEKKKWNVTRTSLINKIFSFMMEGIGKPELEIIGEADALDRFLQKNWEHDTAPHINAALVFADEGALVNADNAPIPTLHLKKLREYIRLQEKGNAPPHAELKVFQSLFPNE